MKGIEGMIAAVMVLITGFALTCAGFIARQDAIRTNKIKAMAELYCRCAGYGPEPVLYIVFHGDQKVTVKCDDGHTLDFDTGDYIRDCTKDAKK